VAAENGGAVKPSTLTSIRLALLTAVVLIALVIGIRHLLPGEAASGGSFDAFCPFGAIETAWVYAATGQTLITTNRLNFAILGGVLAVSVLAGRAFCGWMCPVGGVQEFLARWARRAGSKRTGKGRPGRVHIPVQLPGLADHWLRYAKYLILGLVLLASLTAVYPPLHDFCPARALFSFKLETPLLWSVLLTFLVTSVLVERAWCKYLCPLGALLAVFNKVSPLRLRAERGRCNGCSRCDSICSMGIQDIPDNLRSAECIRCLECLETCARDGSLTLKLG
jgi:polyferredoxin